MRPFLIGILFLFIVGLCLLLGAFSGCAAGGWLGLWLQSHNLSGIAEPASEAEFWGINVGIVGSILGLVGGLWLAKRIAPKEKSPPEM